MASFHVFCAEVGEKLVQQMEAQYPHGDGSREAQAVFEHNIACLGKFEGISS